MTMHRLQCKCECGNKSQGGQCAECKKRRKLQRSALSPQPTSDVPAIVHEVLRSPGRELDNSVRSNLERRFDNAITSPGSISSVGTSFQGKLTVGQPGDRFEVEADRIADSLSSSAPGTGSADRYASRDSQPARTDFTNVRVHTDQRAAAAASAMCARAFTVGNHIVFSAGRYGPTSASGQHLLAHELTHVVQQSSAGQHAQGMLQRTPDTCTYGEIREWAVRSVADHRAPAGLADAKASIGSVCTTANCQCVDGSNATAPADQAAWRNITAATGGTDQSGGGRYMCVGHQNCTIVQRCYRCQNGRRVLVRRQTPLAPSGTTAVAGHGTLYFYNDPLQGWCNAEDRRTACRQQRRRRGGRRQGAAPGAGRPETPAVAEPGPSTPAETTEPTPERTPEEISEAAPSAAVESPAETTGDET